MWCEVELQTKKFIIVRFLFYLLCNDVWPFRGLICWLRLGGAPMWPSSKPNPLLDPHNKLPSCNRSSSREGTMPTRQIWPHVKLAKGSEWDESGSFGQTSGFLCVEIQLLNPLSYLRLSLLVMVHSKILLGWNTPGYFFILS